MSRTLLASLLCLAALAPACTVEESAPADEEETLQLDDKGDGLPRSVTIRRVYSQNQLPVPVQSGAYQIHNIDVGTGLSILVRGSSFTMLFDGGSADDKSGIAGDGRRNGNRLVAYLFGALGPSGPAACTPDGDHFSRIDRPRLRIDHLVLSHAHDDHVSLLPDVLRCYDVANVWGPGAGATTAIYDKFVRAVAAQPRIAYHTAAAPTADRTVALKSGPLAFGPNVTWTRFVDYAADGQTYPLNRAGTASFKILHANGEVGHDANENSIVMRLDLGAVSMLLVGDAESGPRLPPLSPLGDVEKYLVETYPRLIDVDIHQSGHHGSMTSNRDAFLRMVSPDLVLIGAGPKRYGSVVLPDREVIDELESLLGRVAVTGPEQRSQGLGAELPDLAGGGEMGAVDGGSPPEPAYMGPPPGTRLPAARRNPRIVRTDQNDTWVVGTALDSYRPSFTSAGCVDASGRQLDRIGSDDALPGGCDNYIIQIPRMAAATATGD